MPLPNATVPVPTFSAFAKATLTVFEKFVTPVWFVIPPILTKLLPVVNVALGPILTVFERFVTPELLKVPLPNATVPVPIVTFPTLLKAPSLYNQPVLLRLVRFILPIVVIPPPVLLNIPDTVRLLKNVLPVTRALPPTSKL